MWSGRPLGRETWRRHAWCHAWCRRGVRGGHALRCCHPRSRCDVRCRHARRRCHARSGLPCAGAPPCAVPPREVPRVALRVRPFRLRVEAAAARWRLLVVLCPVPLPAPGFWSFLSSCPPPVRNSVPSFNWLNGWRFINPAVTFSDVIEDECPVILGLQIPRAKIEDGEGNLSVRAAGVPGAQALN